MPTVSYTYLAAVDITVVSAPLQMSMMTGSTLTEFATEALMRKPRADFYGLPAPLTLSVDYRRDGALFVGF